MDALGASSAEPQIGIIAVKLTDAVTVINAELAEVAVILTVGLPVPYRYGAAVDRSAICGSKSGREEPSVSLPLFDRVEHKTGPRGQFPQCLWNRIRRGRSRQIEVLKIGGPVP